MTDLLPALAERLDDKIEPEPMSGCWLWMGECNSKGYPWIRRGRSRKIMAHRLIYEQMRGPIPVGLTLDHLCRVRCCMNPSHLEPVTNAVNILRGESWSARNARKVMCPTGHLYLPENTSVIRRTNGSTFRRCRRCKRRQNSLRDLRERLGVKP